LELANKIKAVAATEDSGQRIPRVLAAIAAAFAHNELMPAEGPILITALVENGTLSEAEVAELRRVHSSIPLDDPDVPDNIEELLQNG
jgi:hypothetical protein